MVYPQLGSDKIVVEQALYTSGEGWDYRITAASRGIIDSEKMDIEKESLIKYYFSPDVIFVDAIKTFKLSTGRYAISYVTASSRDEYNRPARFRAHILVSDPRLIDFLVDPRVFKPFFLRKDVFEKIDSLKLNAYDFLIDSISRIFNVRRLLKDVMNLFNDEMLEFIFSALFMLKRVFIVPSDLISVETIEKKTSITSMDVISSILYLLPATLRKNISTGSLVFHGELEKVNIGFLHPSGVLPETSAVVIDLEEQAIHLVGERKRKLKNELATSYTKLVTSSLLDNDFYTIETLTDILNSSLSISRKLGKLGLKFLQKVIDNIPENYYVRR